MTRSQSKKLAKTQGPLATMDIIQMVKMAQLTIHNHKIRDLIAPMIKEVKITLYKMFQVSLCGSRQLLSVKIRNISITNATETRLASQL